jgi:hypothetical protein
MFWIGFLLIFLMLMRIPLFRFLFWCFIAYGCFYYAQLTYFPTVAQQQQAIWDKEDDACNAKVGLDGGWNMHTHQCLDLDQWNNQIMDPSEQCNKNTNHDGRYYNFEIIN